MLFFNVVLFCTTCKQGPAIVRILMYPWLLKEWGELVLFAVKLIAVIKGWGKNENFG
jgi:hypothetical protein